MRSSAQQDLAEPGRVEEPKRVNPRRPTAKGHFWVIPILFGLGCGSGVKSTVREPDETSEAFSVEATLTSKDRDRLQSARTLARDGDYQAAIVTLEEVARKPGLDPGLHQEVLLTLGEMYGSELNALRDYEKATTHLNELLAKYPETHFRERAEALLRVYSGKSR